MLELHDPVTGSLIYVKPENIVMIRRNPPFAGSSEPVPERTQIDYDTLHGGSGGLHILYVSELPGDIHKMMQPAEPAPATLPFLVANRGD